MYNHLCKQSLPKLLFFLNLSFGLWGFQQKGYKLPLIIKLQGDAPAQLANACFTIQKYMIIHDIKQPNKHDLQSLQLFKIINIRYTYVQSLLVMRSTQQSVAYTVIKSHQQGRTCPLPMLERAKWDETIIPSNNYMIACCEETK